MCGFTGVSCAAGNFRMLASAVVFMICLLITVPIQSRTPAPRLVTDVEVASAGFYQLSWETVAERVELQESTSPDFRDSVTSYSGADRAAVISGKPDGTWYYRVRELDTAQPGPWSEPVKVAVIHHSLTRALIFLCLGIFVFVAIVCVIVRGTGKQNG